VRYEIRRATGIGTGFVVGAAVLVVSAVSAVLLARIGHTPQPRLLAAWPRELPLPPAALGAGLLGALAFGDEFRHPALATDRGTVPRRLGLLTAKLLVASATALTIDGPGPLSVDALFGKHRWGVFWGLLGVSAGVLASAAAIEFGEASAPAGAEERPEKVSGDEATGAR